MLAGLLAVSAGVMAHEGLLAHQRAQLATAAPIATQAEPLPPAPASMPATPQTGWRPAGLATGLELQFAPASALRHSPFIHT
jgi:hypothetical protein